MKDMKYGIPGSFEVCLFMMKGVNRYAGSWGEAWRSFTIPLLTGLVAYYMAVIHPPLVKTSVSPELIFGIGYLTMILSMMISLTIMFLFAKTMSRGERFPLMVSVANWTGLPFFLMILVFKTLETANLVGFKASEDVGIVLMIYSMSVSGYLITKTLRIHWFLGAFFAILGFIISQEVLNGLYYIFDVPVIDYSEYFSN